MKRILLLAVAILAVFPVSCRRSAEGLPEEVRMDKQTLQDRIMGAWAGQTIGCTYGGPTEFQYNGTMINDHIPIEYPEHRILWYFDNAPGLYDDVYMDLTFVDVFDKQGLDASQEAFAEAFSHAGYPLWHANQQARYNLQQGMSPAVSGYWKNNPHADDLDFQIESDFAGIMSPGMVRSAVGFADRIGHIMNYGDGWYGGVYVAAMYALAFVSDDVEFVVREALKTIPAQSRFRRCMEAVIRSWRLYPDNWELAWARAMKEFSFDIGCPYGVLKPFNIDAVINSAYILIGLLYGGKDFGKTIDISTRCGYDSDCNPASAAGILGAMLGYSAIPEYWKSRLYEVEDRPFAYTDISLRKAYRLSYEQALAVILREGGREEGDAVVIRCQGPEEVRFEECFDGLWPVARVALEKAMEEAGDLSFDGKGIVVKYSFGGGTAVSEDAYVAQVEVSVDGGTPEVVRLPLERNARRQELYYRYDLPKGSHTVSMRCLNPDPVHPLRLTDYIVYGDRPEDGKNW